MLILVQVSQNLTTIWESFASLGYPQLNTEVRYTEGLSLVQSSQQLQSQVGNKESPKVPNRAFYWSKAPYKGHSLWFWLWNLCKNSIPTVTVTVLLRTGPWWAAEVPCCTTTSASSTRDWWRTTGSRSVYSTVQYSTVEGLCTQLVFCGVLCGAESAHTDRPPECCSFVKKTSTESWVWNIDRKMQCCWKEKSDFYVTEDTIPDKFHFVMLDMEEGSDAKYQAMFLRW